MAAMAHLNLLRGARDASTRGNHQGGANSHGAGATVTVTDSSTVTESWNLPKTWGLRLG